MNAIQEHKQFKLHGTGASHPTSVVMTNLTCSNTTLGYSDSSGVLVPHAPISIADINDNDNFHQLCFPTTDEIVKISMLANTVEDPNPTPICTAKLMSAPALIRQLLRRPFRRRVPDLPESVHG